MRGACRYDAETDVLRLVVTKYASREDNRREVVRILNDLVKAGREEEALLAAGGGGAPAAAAGAGAAEKPQQAGGKGQGKGKQAADARL